MVTRRQLLGLVLVPVAGALVGCQARTDDPRLLLLRADPVATWRPPNLVEEIVKEIPAEPGGFFGGHNFVSLSRRLVFGAGADALGAKEAILAIAEANGWSRPPLGGDDGRVKELANGSSGSLYVSIDSNPLTLNLNLRAD